MEVPSFDLLIKAAATLKPSEKTVVIPLDMLKLLLSSALASGFIDEIGYLAANPDVKGAIQRGEISDAKTHFIENGYFENRVGAIGVFDEEYYLNCNPDVFNAVRRGLWASGKDHYEQVGKFEWRSPNENSEHDWRQWRLFLGKVATDDAEKSS